MEVDQWVRFLEFHHLSACLDISACSEETVEIFLSTRYVEEKRFIFCCWSSFPSMLEYLWPKQKCTWLVCLLNGKHLLLPEMLLNDASKFQLHDGPYVSLLQPIICQELILFRRPWDFFMTHRRGHLKYQSCGKMTKTIPQTCQQAKQPWDWSMFQVIMHILVATYMFVGLAIVCDDFFVPSLTRVSDGEE